MEQLVRDSRTMKLYFITTTILNSNNNSEWISRFQLFFSLLPHAHAHGGWMCQIIIIVSRYILRVQWEQQRETCFEIISWQIVEQNSANKWMEKSDTPTKWLHRCRSPATQLCLFLFINMASARALRTLADWAARIKWHREVYVNNESNYRARAWGSMMNEARLAMIGILDINAVAACRALYQIVYANSLLMNILV